jgi:hypothetical protein
MRSFRGVIKPSSLRQLVVSQRHRAYPDTKERLRAASNEEEDFRHSLACGSFGYRLGAIQS